MTKEGEPSSTSSDVMIIEDDDVQFIDEVIKTPRVARPRFFFMGNRGSAQLVPGSAHEPRTVSTPLPPGPKSPPSQPGSRSPPPRSENASTVAATAGPPAPPLAAQGSAVSTGVATTELPRVSAQPVAAQGSAASAGIATTELPKQTVVRAPPAAAQVSAISAGSRTTELSKVPPALPILSADTVKPDPVGQQAGLGRLPISSAPALVVPPPPAPAAVVQRPSSSTSVAAHAPAVVTQATPEVVVQRPSTSTSGAVAAHSPAPAVVTAPTPEAVVQRPTSSGAVAPAPAILTNPIPADLSTTSAATAVEKASGSASPLSEFDEERFTSQLTIRDPDAPLPPEYEEDVPYDDEEELDEEGDQEEDPYVEVEEHLAAMEEGVDKVRLQKLLDTLRACDQRIRALEEADFDVGDELALHKNAKDLGDWRKRSEECLNQAIALMGLEEPDNASDSEYEPSAARMKPFNYSGSGVHYLDQCLTLLVRQVLEKEAAFSEEKQAGRQADMVSKEYSEGHIAEMMKKIAEMKGVAHLKNEHTHRQLTVHDVFPAFHAAVKKYRGKMFRKTVLPKFIYNFNDPEPPQSAALDEKLKANESQMGFLEKFAEEFEQRKKQEGQVVERDEAHPYAIKPDMSDDAYDLVDDEEDEENAESDVDMEDGLDAVSTTTEERDTDKKPGATQLPTALVKVPAATVDGAVEVGAPGAAGSKRKSDSDSNEASEANSVLKRSRSEVLTDELRDLHVDEAEISLDEDWPEDKSDPPDDDNDDDYPEDINNLLDHD